MKRNILIISILLISTLLFGQKTKKLTVKTDYPSYKETITVLKSDELTREGFYKKEMRGWTVVKGQFHDNIKIGIWEYFDQNGQLAHKIDVEKGDLIYDKFAKQNSDFDKTKFSRPAILLGGTGAMYKSIGTTLRYPPNARRFGTEGNVVLKITINKVGSVETIEVIEGIGNGCDEEAVKIIELIKPEWLPALNLNGQPESSELILPITFRLG